MMGATDTSSWASFRAYVLKCGECGAEVTYFRRSMDGVTVNGPCGHHAPAKAAPNSQAFPNTAA